MKKKMFHLSQVFQGFGPQRVPRASIFLLLFKQLFLNCSLRIFSILLQLCISILYVSFESDWCGSIPVFRGIGKRMAEQLKICKEFYLERLPNIFKIIRLVSCKINFGLFYSPLNFFSLTIFQHICSVHQSHLKRAHLDGTSSVYFEKKLSKIYSHYNINWC